MAGQAAEQQGQGVLPGLAIARMSPKLVRFCRLMASGFDPDTGNKVKTQTHAAELAGLGNTPASCKELASRTMKDARVAAYIEELRQDQWQEFQLQQLEVVQGYRELLDKSLGRVKVRRTVEMEGGVYADIDMHEFKPSEAERALKAMAEITGLMGVKASGGVDRTGDTVAERELSATERGARVIELLKRAGVVGTGQAVAGTNGGVGSVAGTANAGV